MKREPLMSLDHFDDTIDYIDKTIEDRQRQLEQAHVLKKPQVLARANFRDRCESLVARYSRGDAIESLPAVLELAVTDWERYLAFGPACKTDFSYLDDYVRCLWLTSLALLFDVPADTWRRLLCCAGNAGQDRLFERLVSLRSSDRPQARALLHPDVYTHLDRAWDAPASDRAPCLHAFLSNWYAGMRETGWHDSHKGPEGGGFVGYWAFEAAAVVCALNLADESFRDLPYYPKDLADFHRKQRM